MSFQAVLLAGALAALWYFLRGDFGGLRAIAGVPGGWARRRRYRVRTAKALLLFGGTTLVALAILGRLDALVVMPTAFGELVRWFAVGPDFPLILLAGVTLGSLLGIGWAWWRGRGGRDPAMIGDYTEVLPRGSGEVGLALLSGLVAGVTEEMFFRLLLPLLVTGVTGSATVGFAGATTLFGLAHWYQGWRGIVATALAGAMLAAVYLATRQLWLVIALHAVIDVNGMVLRPWASGMLRRPVSS